MVKSIHCSTLSMYEFQIDEDFLFYNPFQLLYFILIRTLHIYMRWCCFVRSFQHDSFFYWFHTNSFKLIQIRVTAVVLISYFFFCNIMLYAFIGLWMLSIYSTRLVKALYSFDTCFPWLIGKWCEKSQNNAGILKFFGEWGKGWRWRQWMVVVQRLIQHKDHYIINGNR